MNKTISLDGVDGVGKSTVINEMIKIINENNKSFELLNNWNDRLLTKNISKKSLDYVTDILFSNLLNSYMDEQDYVLCDRYINTSYVYNLEWDINYPNMMLDVVKNHFKHVKFCEFNVLLVDSVNNVYKRLKSRGEPELSKKSIYKLQTKYKTMFNMFKNEPEIKNLSILNTARFIVIDVRNKTPIEIAKEILDIVNEE